MQEDLDLILTQKWKRLKDTDYQNSQSQISLLREIVELERLKYNGRKQDFASHIFSEITKRDITYPRGGTWYSLFSEEELITTSPTVIHEHRYAPVPDNPDFQACECGLIQFESLVYTVWQNPEQRVVGREEREVAELPWKEHPQTKFLKICDSVGNKIHLTCLALIERYFDSPENKKIIDETLGDVTNQSRKYSDQFAKVDNAKSLIDKRRSWGEYEKIMGAFLMNTGETIANIAKQMDYSGKYGSIGLLRESNVKEFFEKPETYPAYLRRCPNCFEDIAYLMNENINLYRQNKKLKIEVPTIKYN